MSQHNAKIKKTSVNNYRKDGREYNHLEKYLLNNYQREFPLTADPYDLIASELNTTTATIIETLRKLQASGAISRIGPVLKPNSFNTSILAAMAVPDDQVTQIAELVNNYVEVNHNYEREHQFNLWFVLHGPDEDHLRIILDDIENKTSLPLIRLPILDDYHIDLGFDLKWNQ